MNNHMRVYFRMDGSREFTLSYDRGDRRDFIPVTHKDDEEFDSLYLYGYEITLANKTLVKRHQLSLATALAQSSQAKRGAALRLLLLRIIRESR